MRTFCWCSSLGARCENNMIVSANTSHRVLFCVLYHRNLNQSDLEKYLQTFLSLHCHCDQSSVRGVISYHRNSQFLFLFVSPSWNVLCPGHMYERGVYEVWSMLWLSAYVKPESSLQAVRALVSLTLAVTLVTAPTHHHQSTFPSDQLSYTFYHSWEVGMCWSQY